MYIDPKVRDPQDGGYTEGLRIRPFHPKIKADEPIKCEGCGNIVQNYGKMSAKQLADYTRQSYKKILCAGCAAKAKAEKDAAAANSDVLGATAIMEEPIESPADCAAKAKAEKDAAAANSDVLGATAIMEEPIESPADCAAKAKAEKDAAAANSDVLGATAIMEEPIESPADGTYANEIDMNGEEEN